MSHWFEILKIIDSAVKLDTERVIGYSKLLSSKLEQEGETKIANNINKIITSKSAGVLKAAESNITKLPFDQESKYQLAEVIHPGDIDEDVVLSKDTTLAIEKFVTFYDNRDRLLSAGVDPLNTILLYGPPGCGKTLLAKNLSKRLRMPIVIARLDSLISSFLGSTSKNVRNLFEYVQANPCILFLDEFDAIAKQRDDKQELGELKRVVNSLLQNIDMMDNGSILIAATNHEQLLDPAVWRRFSLKILVDKPDFEARLHIIKNHLSSSSLDDIEMMAHLFRGLSGAAITEVCKNAKREAIISNKDTITLKEISDFFFNSYFSTDSNHLSLDKPVTLEQRIFYLRELDQKVFNYSVIGELLGISKSTISRILNKQGSENS